MGNLNGHVGSKNGGMEEYIGKEGEEKINNNGKSITENNLIIAQNSSIRTFSNIEDWSLPYE